MNNIYISYPVGKKGNSIETLKGILNKLEEDKDINPIAPYILYYETMDKANTFERSIAMNRRLRYIRKSVKEVWVYGTTISIEMWVELRVAVDNEIPIKFKTKETKELFNKFKTLLDEV